MKISKFPVLLMMLLFLLPGVYALDFTYTSALKTKPKTDQPAIPVTVQVMLVSTSFLREPLLQAIPASRCLSQS